MNNQLRYNVRKLQLAYFSFRYSQYFPIFVPLFVTAIGLLIFAFFVLPEVRNWFSLQHEIEATQKRIQTMQHNTNLMQSIRRADIDDDFSMTIQALPADKDFLGILNIISDAASASKVTLHEYHFMLGKVDMSKDITKSKLPKQQEDFEIQVSANGDVNSIIHFIRELESKLPIAHISTLSYTNGKADMSIVFHVKPFPNITFQSSDPVTALNNQEKQFIQTLRERQ